MKTERIILGGGCFWCTEAAFQLIRGIVAVEPGYAGGSVPDPTYEAVCTGKTGHAEVVRVEFDISELTLLDVLDIFWAIHNPTTLNRQGNDVGSEYRSIILYEHDDQLSIIESSIKKIQELWSDPIVTEVAPLHAFYPAEAKHHNFFRKNPSQAYCQIVINPKLEKLRRKFTDRIAA